MRGRRGDHLLFPFECDECVFRKLKQSSPDWSRPSHQLLRGFIRRMNLDAMWARATSTVEGNARRVLRMIEHSEELGIPAPFMASGPLPPYDYCGYSVAILMLRESLRPGRHHDSHQQYDSIRRVRATHTNHYRTTKDEIAVRLTLHDATGAGKTSFGRNPTNSLWFERFNEGLKRRMGQDWRPDEPMTSELLIGMLNEVVREAQASLESEAEAWIMFGAYAAICFVLGLRGNEGRMLDLRGLIDHWDDAKTKAWFPVLSDNAFTVVPLIGKFKSEHHDRNHLLFSVNETTSGIRVRDWLAHVKDINEKNHRVQGPAFAPANGNPYESREFKDRFIRILCSTFHSSPELFPQHIRSVEDIEDRYDPFRSFRRGSTSRAVTMKIAQADINVVMRWQKKEQAGTSRQGMSMLEHYSDPVYTAGCFLRFTAAM